MRDDLRDAVRSLRTHRGFTIAALIVLTLGIGATTAIFLVAAASVATIVPAWRAASVDPAAALRAE